MTISKKDYIAIADILQNASGLTPSEDTVSDIADDLADYFQKENLAFDRERFLSASRIPWPPIAIGGR